MKVNAEKIPASVPSGRNSFLKTFEGVGLPVAISPFGEAGLVGASDYLELPCHKNLSCGGGVVYREIHPE